MSESTDTPESESEPEPEGTPDSERDSTGPEAPAAQEIEINWSWDLHEGGQREIAASDARFKIVACGRRWGKTRMAARFLIDRALSQKNAKLWWVGPTYSESDIGHEMVAEMLPLADHFVTRHKRSKPQRIELWNGTVIEFKSADRPDGLVGVGLDYLVLDEAAMIPGRAWKTELRPTLSDTLGEMAAISTPKGRNWYREYFQRGQSPDYPDVESWQFTTYDNPHVPDSEIDSAKEELPERIFRQEYLAEFIDEQGGVFSGIRQVVGEYSLDDFQPTGETPSPEPHAIGVDFARHEDYTVITVLNADGVLVDFVRLQSGGTLSWPQIQHEVEKAHDRHPGIVCVDATRDNKIVSDLEASGMRVAPIKFSGQRKRELVENLATQIEQQEIAFPEIPELITELEAFEYDVTAAGNVRYHAPEGFHDDAVDALSLSAWGLRRHRPQQVPTTWSY